MTSPVTPSSPVGMPDAEINAMCLTWRHDFGLNAPPADKDGRMAWSDGASMGMTQQERDALRLQMRQIYQHHVIPAILRERERCAKVADDMLDKLYGEPGLQASYERALLVRIAASIRGTP